MKLQKITSKRAIIAFILLVISILSITTLCYGMASYQIKSDGISFNYRWGFLYGESLTTTGYSLLDGVSALLDGSFSQNLGLEFTGTAIVYQLLSILILIAALVSFILLLLYFFVDDNRASKVAKIIVIINIVCAVAYLIVGICFMAECEDTYVSYYDELNEKYYSYDGYYTYTDNKFTTYAYIPLILSVFSAIIYFVCDKYIKNDLSISKIFFAKILITVKEIENNGLQTNGVADAMDETQAETAITETDPEDGSVTASDMEMLIKLKKLYDDGILTEEEFSRQKELIFNNRASGAK